MQGRVMRRLCWTMTMCAAGLATTGPALAQVARSQTYENETAAHRLADKFSKVTEKSADVPTAVEPVAAPGISNTGTLAAEDIPAPDKAKLEALIEEAEDVARQAAAEAKAAREQAVAAERKAYEKDLLRRAQAEAERQAVEDNTPPRIGPIVVAPPTAVPPDAADTSVAKARAEKQKADVAAATAKREAERQDAMARQRERESEILSAKLRQVREERARLEALGDKLKDWPTGPDERITPPLASAPPEQDVADRLEPSEVKSWPGLDTWDTADPEADVAAPLSPEATEVQMPPEAPSSTPTRRAAVNPPATARPTLGTTARRPEGKVAVLLAMKPGKRGIRRWRKSADPMICLTNHCYVSLGAARAAERLRRNRAFGPGIALGMRAGKCSNSLTCVFRGVDLDRDGLSLQPIDLRLIRHDRRPARGIDALSQCSVSRGELTCTGVVDGGDWVAWIVPETVAAKVSERQLNAAVATIADIDTAAR